MPKLTKSQSKQMAEELITLQPMLERYKQLEAELKVAVQYLKIEEIKTRTGRVLASISERLTVSPIAARSVLGEELAKKVIRVKKTVSNPVLKTFHEVGDITDDQMICLRKSAEKKIVVSLHIRPLE